MPNLHRISTMTDDRSIADGIASTLVASRRAAATHLIGPIISTYWWRGEVQQAAEWRVDVLTTPDLSTEVIAAIQKQHNYDLPVITIDIIDATEESVRWAADATSKVFSRPLET